MHFTCRHNTEDVLELWCNRHGTIVDNGHNEAFACTMTRTVRNSSKCPDHLFYDYGSMWVNLAVEIRKIYGGEQTAFAKKRLSSYTKTHICVDILLNNSELRFIFFYLNNNSLVRYLEPSLSFVLRTTSDLLLISNNSEEVGESRWLQTPCLYQ